MSLPSALGLRACVCMCVCVCLYALMFDGVNHKMGLIVSCTGSTGESNLVFYIQCQHVIALVWHTPR